MTLSPPLAQADAAAPAEAHEPSPHPLAVRVAASYACDRETRELAEDYAALTKVDRAHRLLERRLTRAAVALQSRRAIASVTEFNLLLADARHDAAWASTLALAKDAAEEARLVKIARTFAPPR